ncbi:MAG: DUF4180 domain-containing protein, partial [Candidatus Sericytochromatia bacterium]
MLGHLVEHNGHRFWLASADGPALGDKQDALDLLGETWGQDVEGVVVPASRLKPEFLELRTGMAGEFIQTMINYRLWFAVVGDISVAVERSTAMRDYVRESNRGRHVHFLARPCSYFATSLLRWWDAASHPHQRAALGRARTGSCRKRSPDLR